MCDLVRHGPSWGLSLINVSKVHVASPRSKVCTFLLLIGGAPFGGWCVPASFSVVLSPSSWVEFNDLTGVHVNVTTAAQQGPALYSHDILVMRAHWRFPVDTHSTQVPVRGQPQSDTITTRRTHDKAHNLTRERRLVASSCRQIRLPE